MAELNRREFTESVLVVALAPVLGIVPSAAGPLTRSPAVRRALDAGGDLDALAEALAGVVRAQYGERLGAEDLAAVTRQIRSALDRAEQMRGVDLANGDEPDFVFAAPPPGP